MSKEIAKTYEPSSHEDEIYKKWEESGFFNPDNLTGEPYSIMMPPPNVTGVLHLGHALENSLMDVMIRYQRMRGKKALLLPGTDHAAVATQAKVEKLLIEQGIKNPREELGREKLLEKIREYSEQSKATILTQIKKMGTSCDWSRLAYTFDEPRNKAVNEVFVRMYNDGLIYRGYRVVNWSVKGQSTCSDDELVHVERQAKLYTFKYGKDFPITIATTRPETKLGDTAVAVNPNDERYQEYIGKTYVVDVGAAKPLNIKIITDENVEMAFGTGALGVTPAHSAVDFEMYEKQKAKGEPIELIQVIGQDGKMTAAAGGNYVGLKVTEAREKFVEWLKGEDLLEKEEDITQSVGTSDRFGDVVESLPMTQWFVDVNKKIPGKGKSLRELIKEAVEIGHNNNPEQKININPERFEKVFFHWINNLRDWCISRQIWWGHRIPAWYKVNSKFEPEIYVGETPPSGEGWLQDEDTLDTWFSSGMWTFSTLNKSGDAEMFHPTSWMQMGYEILFLWMVRMILMSTYVRDEIPFKDVYIHGMLRDEKGEKFSKSKGNNIDPLEVIEKYGTDALRFSLLNSIAPGNDARFYFEKVEGARNLVNKLWNISRYISGNSNQNELDKEIDSKQFTASDIWILSKMKNLISEVTDDFEKFQFSQASEKLRIFTWDDLADWYLEAAKFEDNKETKGQLLTKINKDLLKLWHPFIPFVTEVIWHEMFNGELLLAGKWPKTDNYESLKEEKFELIKDVITSIRNARSENKVEPAKKIKAVIFAGSHMELIKSQSKLIINLRTGIEEIEILAKGDKPDNAIFITVGEIEIYLLGARDEAKEKIRLTKEIENLEKQIKIVEGKLNNQEFVERAPAAIIEKEKAKLAGWQIELEKLKNISE
ncbi:MAG: Valine-tRNA ligase [Parcubacteria group bacterium GW2011_GWE2_39_37]|uniref:Valine--tRNA ligase n=1 Tax=Candidatus Falkowbacteria bacterium GW2011_GWF2_39_8 TaxID=1618642 RepID=A0A0G0PTN7_9BACT|nr:MAG: Valine-tRNA ligase [Parcubacteria group bacterium GW2011_GWE2_39_37]KKR31258.1 MAG: Valine-tRNA ligase [Candidatus Falkowbacteria bacterium GW2011_GWF2_39_8]